MIRVISTLLLFINLSICAQDFLWVNRFGGLQRDAIATTAIDSSGNSYHSGYFSQELTFDGYSTMLNAVGNDDIFVTKFDKDGGLVWAKQISGSGDEYAQEMLIRRDGTLLLFGRFKGVVDVDMSADEHFLTSTGSGFNTFLACYDIDGNFIRAVHFTGDGNNTPYNVRLDERGSIYLSGRFTGSVDFDPDPNISNDVLSAGSFDSYLIKLDTAGLFEWGKHFTGTSSVLVQDITIYGDEIYFVGNFQGSMKILPETTSARFSLGVNDLFITKMDVDGTLDTLIPYGTIRNEDFRSIEVGTNGIFLSGTFLNEIDIDPDPSIENILLSNGGVDAFVLAFDSELRLDWVQHFGGSSYDLAGRIHIQDGLMYFSFRYDGGVILEVSGEDRELMSDGGTDVAILTMDINDGSVLSVYEIKGTGSEFEILSSFDEGEFLISGGFEGSTDFDDTESQNHIVISYGVTDCFVMRVKLKTISGSFGVSSLQPMCLYPVPVSKGGTLNLGIEEFNGVVQIIDAFGRVLQSQYSISSQLQVPSHLPPNMYFALCTSDTGSQHIGHFIVQ
jgi:hypothetical protein